jgi:hypothetical protein
MPEAGASFEALKVVCQNTRLLISEVTDFMVEEKQDSIVHELCLLSLLEDAWWNGGRASCILDLGVRWWLVVSFLSRPLGRKLGGSQSQSGFCSKERQSLHLLGTETRQLNLYPSYRLRILARHRLFRLDL